MKKLISITLILLATFAVTATAQNSNSSTASTTTAAKPKAPRKPIFRATKEQIKQAQKILKDRSFYAGEETGKLDADTRAGLKKYQTAESLKVTGTLNKITLEKMAILLTDRQRAM
jgi:peptidoglycan hydrolase-like protein with peptidoglycan-binding domain